MPLLHYVCTIWMSPWSFSPSIILYKALYILLYAWLYEWNGPHHFRWSVLERPASTWTRSSTTSAVYSDEMARVGDCRTMVRHNTRDSLLTSAVQGSVKAASLGYTWICGKERFHITKTGNRWVRSYRNTFSYLLFINSLNVDFHFCITVVSMHIIVHIGVCGLSTSE